MLEGMEDLDKRDNSALKDGSVVLNICCKQQQQKYQQPKGTSWALLAYHGRHHRYCHNQKGCGLFANGTTQLEDGRWKMEDVELSLVKCRCWARSDEIKLDDSNRTATVGAHRLEYSQQLHQ